MNITYYNDLKNIKNSQNSTALYLITEDINLKELRVLNKSDFYGAVVPHIIVGKNLYKSGILQITFNADESVKFHMLDMTKVPKTHFQDNSTLIMFSDSLNEYFEPFIEKLDNIVSNQVLFGSGVGSREFKPISPLFDTNQSYKTHSLFVEISSPIHVGVQHGWEAFSGPFVVTKSEDNIIYELNNEPAFDVYVRILKELDDQVITEDNFFDIAKAYPFGILSYTQNEFIVRDPLQPIHGNALLMVSSIKTNESIYIMKGEHSGLVNAASQNAKNTISKNADNVNILFDCISRVLYMGDDFTEELTAISSQTPDSLTTYGITSIGEITNSGFSSIKIFNKTNLIGSIDNV